MMYNLLVSAVIVLILATSVKCQEITNPIRNITVTAGEDIFLDWSNQDPARVLWTKDGAPVDATVAAQEKRIHVVKEKGLLILNSKWEDRGYYAGFVVTKEPARTFQQGFSVDVAPTEDNDLSSGGEFSCGFPRVRGKVIGGSPVEHGQNPWTVLLYDSVMQTIIGTGVLLNRRWVLTVAHLIAYSRFNDSNKDELELRFGENDRYKDEGTEVTLRIEQIISHPNFDRETYDSDIALLKLRQPVTYSDYILPICLPSELRAQRLVKGEKSGFITGWGRTSRNFTSNVLQKVRLTIVNQETCGQMHYHLISNNMFCARAHDSNVLQDACQGDAGGPFAIKDNDRWYLAGLVSWGIGCANPNFPGVYTRVHRFRQWIEDLITDDMETCEEKAEELTQANMQLTELEAQLKAKVEDLKEAISETSSEPKPPEPTHTTRIQTLLTTTRRPATLPSQGEITNRIQNITVTAGEDIFLDWSNQDPARVLWTKDGVPVEATVAAQETRIYVVKEKGLLILNSKWEDRGYYAGFVVTKEPARTFQQDFSVDVAPTADNDLSSGGEFSCGFRRVRGKVIGGRPVKHGQNPWTVLLYDRVNQNIIGAGVLLNRRWVLTGAHAFSHSLFNDNNKDELELRFGEYDINQVEGTEVTLQIEQIITHPNFDRETFDSDIALLKLRQPVTYSDYILPICLPSELRAQRLVNGEKSGFVTGWGGTRHSSTSNVLRKVRLSIVNQEACGQMSQYVITNNMLCAGPHDPNVLQDACRGDAGAPFIIKDNDRWYLAGLVSWGMPGSGSSCGNLNTPGVYTRVHRFRQWIKDLITEGMDTCEEKAEKLTQAHMQLTELGAQLKATDEELKKATYLNCGEGLGPLEDHSGKGRVVGGHNAAPGAWPWMVGLYELYREFEKHHPIFFCGGSLISSDTVLTAAHCFDPDRAGIEKLKENIIVVAGATERVQDRETLRSPPRNLQMFQVVEIIKHEQYDWRTYDYDIALLRLQTEVNITSMVKPVCLPDSRLERNADLLKVGVDSLTYAYVTGWGSVKPHRPTTPESFIVYSVHLKQLAMPLRNRTTCAASLENPEEFTESMICAGFIEGEQTDRGELITYTGQRDACFGDSGGPLVRARDVGGIDIYYQIGIVSWGIGCALKDSFGFYTDVPLLVDWINNKTAGIP